MGRGTDLKKRKTRSDKHSPDDVVRCWSCQKLYRRSQLSKRGLCGECGVHRVLASIRQLQSKQGVIYERWAARVNWSKHWKKGGN